MPIWPRAGWRSEAPAYRSLASHPFETPWIRRGRIASDDARHGSRRQGRTSTSRSRGFRSPCPRPTPPSPSSSGGLASANADDPPLPPDRLPHAVQLHPPRGRGLLLRGLGLLLRRSLP